MKTELLKFSNRIQELSSITEEEILQNQDFFKIQTLKKGDPFVREGKICTNIAFINQGTFRIYRLKNGEELNTCFCMKCDVMSSFESFVNIKITNAKNKNKTNTFIFLFLNDAKISAFNFFIILI